MQFSFFSLVDLIYCSLIVVSKIQAPFTSFHVVVITFNPCAVPCLGLACLASLFWGNNFYFHCLSLETICSNMQHNEVISVCVCVHACKRSHRNSLWQMRKPSQSQMLIPPGCDNCFMTLYATRIRLVWRGRRRSFRSAQRFFIWSMSMSIFGGNPFRFASGESRSRSFVSSSPLPKLGNGSNNFVGASRLKCNK